jgi:hypothetical protein
MAKANEQQHFEHARKWQEEFDRTLEDLGARADSPVLGQTCNDYIRESFRTIKRTFLPKNHQVYKMNMRGLPADLLRPTWDNLLKPAIQIEAFNPATVPKGELREIKRKMPNGQVQHHFIGQDCFVKFMGRPGRRVTSFWTGEGPPLGASGQFLR